MLLSLPAAPGDFPDPWLLPTGGGWLAFATNSGGRNVQVRSSADLRSWRDLPDALPRLPAWAAPGATWSPAVTATGDRWVMWYAARHAGTGRQALGVAVADRPEGPYADLSGSPALLQADLGGSIDPSVATGPGGERYLAWKADTNALGGRSTLWAAPLSPDCATLLGEPVLLLGADRRWERPLVEAPSLLATPEGWMLWYSAGRWASPGYCIGWATAPDLAGPWRTCRRPWAATGPPAAGPGGQEAVRCPDGTVLLAYHAWEPGRVGYRTGGERTLRIGRLDLGTDPPGLRPLER